MKLFEVQKKLLETGFFVFTTHEFQRATGFSLTGARKFLLRYTQKGVFWQLKRGLYAFKDTRLSPWLIANRLYMPSYISLDTALSYYGMIPETVYGVTSVTTKVTREFEACDLLFSYHAIQQGAYCGYCPLKRAGQTVFMAEPEKALADMLYFVHLGRRELNARLTCQKINQRRFYDYLKLFRRKNLMTWGQDVISKKS